MEPVDSDTYPCSRPELPKLPLYDPDGSSPEPGGNRRAAQLIGMIQRDEI